MSIYDLTGDKMYIDKAEQLAKKLMPAFSTPTGIPYTTINLNTYVVAHCLPLKRSNPQFPIFPP